MRRGFVNTTLVVVTMLIIALVGGLTFLVKSVIENPTGPDEAARSPLSLEGPAPRAPANGPAGRARETQGANAPVPGGVGAQNAPAAGNAPQTGSLSAEAGNAPAAVMPAVPLRSDLDRYIRWLRFAENERARVRVRNQSIRASLDALPALVDPAEREREQKKVQDVARGALTAVRILPQALLRTRPPVPPECTTLNSRYTAALEQEATLAAAALESVAENDPQRIANLRRTGAASVVVGLRSANVELEKLYRSQKAPQPFQVQSGMSASMATDLIRAPRE
jgi:hypothetical protein